MLSASSPITFPPSSSPPLKRPCPSPSRPQDVRQRPKPRARGGFLVEDDSDSDSDEEASASGPAPKRIQVEAPNQRQPSHPANEVSPSQPEDAGASSLVEDARALENPDTQPGQRTIDLEEELNYQSLLDLSRSTSAAILGRHGPLELRTCSGKTVPIKQRKPTAIASVESIVAARSRTKEGRAKRSYYGIEIHALLDGAEKELKELKDRENTVSAAPVVAAAPMNPDQPVCSVEDHADNSRRPKKTLLWTEKYRARKFMDLVGDDLTNRQVLRWLKRWDPLVFPHAAKSKAAASRRLGAKTGDPPAEEKPHRKILMLTGPPGLGKTTLAHVCARQAGYEVLEINASDDRSRDVVRGRIRTSLGTENVRTVEHSKTGSDGKPQKIARPVCVVVDEVDGVVSGSGASGDGGFVKALIDLVMTDQKNSAASANNNQTANGRRNKKKGDDFRQMRPLVLICNDVYHASLRPLRQSGLAEIIHVGKPSVDAVVTRLKSVFEKEGIPCEKDAARKLCEAAWGMSSGIDAKRGAESNVEGDLRGVMVVGEWVAGRFRASDPSGSSRLTRQWVEQNIVQELAHGGGGARGLGRGGTKDIVSRIFQEGAGFPKQNIATKLDKATRRELPKTQLGFSEQQKKHAMARLSEMVETSGEVDRILTDVLVEYPEREFNDDCYLTKPNTAYEWMHFHDACSTRLFSGQEWELAPYLSQPVLACHHLFASPHRHVAAAGYDKHWGGGGGDGSEQAAAAAPVPFSGPRADYEAREAEKHNRAVLQGIQAQLPAALSRAFRSPEQVATDLLSYLVRMVSPNVKPVVVGGSGDKWGSSIASVRREGEKAMVRRAADVLAELGIALLKGKIEEANPSTFSRPQWVYRMEPDLDALATFETMGAYLLATQAPTRYAVRQVLDQELHKTLVTRQEAARQARFTAGTGTDSRGENFALGDKENTNASNKRKNTKAGGVGGGSDNKENEDAGATALKIVKRDFFGRVVEETTVPLRDVDGNARPDGGKPRKVVWVTFNEGLNNAVRKSITVDEFLRGL